MYTKKMINSLSIGIINAENNENYNFNAYTLLVNGFHGFYDNTASLFHCSNGVYDSFNETNNLTSSQGAIIGIILNTTNKILKISYDGKILNNIEILLQNETSIPCI